MRESKLHKRKIRRVKFILVIEFIVIGLLLTCTDIVKIEVPEFGIIEEPKYEVVYKIEMPYSYDYEFTNTYEEPKTNNKEEVVVAVAEVKPVTATAVSDNCINMIKKFEGCKLEAYKLKGESNYTIGYGTSNRSIRKGQRITEKEAEKMLLDEIAKIEKYLNKKDIELNQNEYDALVSFGFNCGIGNLNKLISGRNKEEIADHIMAYTGSSNASNRRGLEKRRTEEKAMFLGGM